MKQTKKMINDSKVLISKDDLHARIKELGAEIRKDYENSEELILICVLKGSVMFLVDLSKELGSNVMFDFMTVSSYHGGTESSGKVKIIKDLDYDISGKDILIVEDIIDTGRSLKAVLEILEPRNPKSLKICTLLDKPSQRVVEMTADYTGFTIPNKFVIGYGLDLAEKARNIDHIAEVILD